MRSVLIALPCYGGIMSAKTTIGLFNLAKVFTEINLKHDILIVSNQSLIPKARSDIANYFWNATNFDCLMWIDADLGFTVDDFFKLYDLNVEHAMATYRHKSLTPHYSFTLKTENNKIQWNKNKTACKISKNVGGFSLINRSVFDKVSLMIPELKYKPYSNSRTVSEKELNNSYHFYDTPISKENLSLMPEDFAFHEKCINAGMDMWLRTDIQLTHNGNTDFVGTDLDKILKESNIG